MGRVESNAQTVNNALQSKDRRRLTLDLYTRYGDFWELIEALRAEYAVSPIVGIPPEPDFHAESVGLMSRLVMPERFHMPPETPDHAPYNLPPELVTSELRQAHRWGRVAGFLGRLEVVWRECIPEDIRSGTNVAGHLSWAPFLSACVMFDPPPDRLLEFADHDDHFAAALPKSTFWQEPDDVAAARVALKELFRSGDADRYSEAIELFRQSFRPSTLAPNPPQSRGRPPVDDLEAVQCAIWRRDGNSSLEIGQRLAFPIRPNDHETGERSDKAERVVRRGEEILKRRSL